MAAAPQLSLRGHHLICLQFFRGEGYTDQFVKNLLIVLDQATHQDALVVMGIDDVCVACPELGSDAQCASKDAGGEEEVALLDELALSVLEVGVGEQLTLAEARERLEANAVGVGLWRARACDGCAWESVCDSGWDALLKAAERAARRLDAN
jgi:hypothetical protein